MRSIVDFRPFNFRLQALNFVYSSAYCLFPVAQNDLVHISAQKPAKRAGFFVEFADNYFTGNFWKLFPRHRYLKGLTMDDFGK